MARMRYCGPRGIPLSTFLSWSQDDQDAALSWAGHEAQRCGTCGYHPDEYSGVHAHIDQCPGCVKREAAQGAAKDVPGAHIHLAHGGIGDCARCIADVRARKGPS